MTKTKLIIILICWQLLIAFWVRMGLFVKPNVQNIGNIWQENFDGKKNLAISERNYTDADWKLFPMYPHLIGTASRLIENRVLSGLILSLGGFSVAIWYFIKLLRLDESEGVVITTLITFLLFPTSFFMGVVYSEGLFFMWIVLSFYFARKKNWPLAGLFGMFASYTNFFGIFLFPAIFIEVWKNKKQKRDLFWILLIPLGFWFYASYVGLTSGDLLSFYEFKFDQIVMWYQIVWRYIKNIYLLDIVKIFELIVGVVFGIVTAAAFWKSRLSYALFGFLVYLAPSLTGTFISMPRFILFSFSSFLLLSRWLHARPFLKWLVWGFELILLAVFTILFSKGYFVS